MAVGHRDSNIVPLRVHLYPAETVAQMRADYPDAAAFVADTTCLGCGVDAASARANRCDSCQVSGCDCELTEDPHGAGIYCTDCDRYCGCRTCEG